jgi:mono/diheme cytochrome c family protein
MSHAQVNASSIETAPKKKGDAEDGKKIFHGKGICSYCHGQEGHLDQRPPLNPDTTAFINRLNPQPADLRNPRSLKLHTDSERFRAVREGHPGTGMFPDTTLTDKEILKTLAYLAILRQEGDSNRQPQQ